MTGREQWEVSTRQAVSFVISKQEDDGHWSDFDLPVGRATTWVTAYTLNSLRGRPELNDNIARGLQWLLTRYRPGWGYNESVPIDCDSTAWGILALNSAAIDLPNTVFATLNDYRDSEGLYRTFVKQPEWGHWADPHLDVTAIALRALLRCRSVEVDQLVRTAIQIVQLGENDQWQAYWWSDQMYAVAHALEALWEFEIWVTNAGHKELPGEEIVKDLSPRIAELRKKWRERLAVQNSSSDPFALAMQLKVARFSKCSDERIAGFIRMLLDCQQPNGSWKGNEKLRVTDRMVEHPWEHPDPGPLFADSENLFTTATVVDALKV